MPKKSHLNTNPNAPEAQESSLSEITSSIDNARLYRRKVVQQYIGIGETKFYELVKRGEIETRKIGAATVVPGYSLRRFIEKTIAA